MQSLFPQSQGGPGVGGDGGVTLISFKAGRLNMGEANSTGTFKVTADERKGTISLVRRPIDNLVHFKWTDRQSGQDEEDKIIFPNDAKFRKVKTGRDGDRVYMLNMVNAQRMMFWMQDKSDEKDKENAERLNELINNATAAQAAANELAAPTGTSGGSNMSPDAWMQLLGLQQPAGGMPGTGGPSTGATSGTATNVPNAGGNTNTAMPPPPPTGGLDFSSLLGNLGGSTTPAPSQAGLSVDGLRAAMQGALNQGPEPLQLQQIVTADEALATGLLEDEDLCNQLISQLPQGQQSREFLETAIRSPQLADSMRALSRALHGENYLAVMANIGVDPTPGLGELNQGRGEAVTAFLTALMAANPPTDTEDGKTSDE